MKRWMIVVAALAVAACCLIGSAGVAGGVFLLGNQPPGPEEAVRLYYDSLQHEDWDRAWDQFTPEMQRQISVEDLKEPSPLAGKIRSFVVTDAKVDGESATVVTNIVWENQRGHTTAALSRIDGRWRISGFR